MVYRALALTFAALLVQATAEEAITADQEAELQKEIDSEFKRMDTNNDGYLDSKELDADTTPAEEKGELMQHDADKDGKLSKSEMMSFARASFLQDDEDEDEEDEEDEDEEEDDEAEGQDLKAP